MQARVSGFGLSENSGLYQLRGYLRKHRLPRTQTRASQKDLRRIALTKFEVSGDVPYRYKSKTMSQAPNKNTLIPKVETSA